MHKVAKPVLICYIGRMKAKKVAKKSVKKPKAAGKKATAKVKAKSKAKAVGKVTHYYDKIGVAIIKLATGLKVGDTIKITIKNGELEQVVDSMQVDHEAIAKAKKGDVIGLKVSQPVKEGAKVTL